MSCSLLKAVAVSAAMFMAGAVQVSADDFDFASQRGEVQRYDRVSGSKLQHTGAAVNPVPHEWTRTGGEINVTRGFRVSDKGGRLGDCIGMLARDDRGIRLTIEYGDKQADKAHVRPESGAYRLEVSPRGVRIVGRDESGAFYGLQTLRQLVEHDPSAVGCCVINDWPSLPRRGVVEGFYGTPWSHEARLGLLDMFGRYKLNTYIYGPKDDPYHSSPHWRKPYPDEQAADIRELCVAARQARVNFVWAIHPGRDIRWNKADYDSLLNKFNAMYDLGVRGFALFFDDIEGEGTDPHRQAQLVNDLTRDFVRVKGDVLPLMICPTDYSQLWANPGEHGTLAVYGRELEPDVDVFWTGAVVCSDLTPETLEFVDSRIRRPAMYWWNFPVTDYCRDILLQGPAYGLDSTLTSAEVAGIMSNPMEHAEASKPALYGVADYAWNMPAYNALDNWERAMAVFMPGAPEAYRAFAIHSADTGDGYRRDESWETRVIDYNSYTPEDFDALRADFERLAAAPAAMRARGGNPALVAEIDPWLTQAEELAGRGLRTLDLIKTYEQGTDSAFWTGYLANVMTDKQHEGYMAHKLGTLRLQPFYENTMSGMLAGRYWAMAGQMPTVSTPLGTYDNLENPVLRNLIVDGDASTCYTSCCRQAKGEWLGLDMGRVRRVDEIEILQGRNPVDDGNIYDLAVVEASVDGKRWMVLSDTLRDCRDIRCAVEPVDARYVRMRRLDDSQCREHLSIREFRVNPATPRRVGFGYEVTSSSTPGAVERAMSAFDNNPLTAFEPDGGTLSLDRIADATVMILLNGPDSNRLTVTQLDARGNAVGEPVTVTAPYAAVPLEQSARRITVSGHGAIRQLIQR